MAYCVKEHSDEILSLKVAEQVQLQQIEQAARAAEAELLKKSPDLRREISVQNPRLATDQHSLSRRSRNSHRFPILFAE